MEEWLRSCSPLTGTGFSIFFFYRSTPTMSWRIAIPVLSLTSTSKQPSKLRLPFRLSKLRLCHSAGEKKLHNFCFNGGGAVCKFQFHIRTINWRFCHTFTRFHCSKLSLVKCKQDRKYSRADLWFNQLLYNFYAFPRGGGEVRTTLKKKKEKSKNKLPFWY